MNRKYDVVHKNTSLNDSALKFCDNVNEYVFVETGTNIGAGIEFAIKKCFKHIISIENDRSIFDIAKRKFILNKDVEIFFGDSKTILPKICKDIDNKCFFWLDAHGYESSPLKSELEYIISRNNPDDIIAIDDIRIMTSRIHWGLSTNYYEIIDLLNINKFNTSFIDSFNAKKDIMVCKK